MSTNKEKIGISIDAALLARIDTVCEARNEARSAWFERIATRAIEEEEQFTKSMENPVIRGVARALVAQPKILKLVAMLSRESMSSEEEQRIAKELDEQLHRGLDRAAKRRKGK